MDGWGDSEAAYMEGNTCVRGHLVIHFSTCTLELIQEDKLKQVKYKIKPTSWLFKPSELRFSVVSPVTTWNLPVHICHYLDFMWVLHAAIRFQFQSKLKHIQFTNVLIDNSSCIHGIMLGSSITNIKNTCGTITHAIMQYTLQLLSSLNDLLWIFQLTELRMLRLVLAELNATADHNAKRQERKRRITKTLHTHTFIAMFELLNLPHHLFF